jgi:hypothetical protein
LPAALSVLLANGCWRAAQKKSNVTLRCRVQPQPPQVGTDTVTIDLIDSGGRPVAGASISLEADMSHPGMAPVFGTVRESRAGSYWSTLNLNMPGDWTLLVKARLSSGEQIEQQLHLQALQK